MYKKLFSNLQFGLAIRSFLLLLLLVFEIYFAYHKNLTWCVILAVCLFLIVIELNFWLRNKIVKPLKRLTLLTQSISEGNYGVQCEKTTGGELGLLTDQVNKMSKKIAESDKVRTEFISQVSHELRTPLTAIIGWSETLCGDENASPEMIRGLNFITKEANRLTDMVKDLLEFTRLQDGRFTLRLESMDIVAELEDSIFTYGEFLRQSGLELHYAPPTEDIPNIQGDPERLRQVFLNILNNSAAHGNTGKTVEVGIARKDQNVLITIRDHGQGISPDDLPHVKEKFYKGRDAGRGSGIGLAVCDEIITRHGGTLSIENAEGGGCLVTISLPLENIQ
jgi:two-component system OmpR family sensor kinase